VRHAPSTNLIMAVSRLALLFIPALSENSDGHPHLVNQSVQVIL
jgi:hypothetical protein